MLNSHALMQILWGENLEMDKFEQYTLLSCFDKILSNFDMHVIFAHYLLIRNWKQW